MQTQQHRRVGLGVAETEVHRPVPVDLDRATLGRQLDTGARHGRARVLADLCGAYVILQGFGDYPLKCSFARPAPVSACGQGQVVDGEPGSALSGRRLARLMKSLRKWYMTVRPSDVPKLLDAEGKGASKTPVDPALANTGHSDCPEADTSAG
jgi:hypothetical protein